MNSQNSLFVGNLRQDHHRHPGHRRHHTTDITCCFEPSQEFATINPAQNLNGKAVFTKAVWQHAYLKDHAFQVSAKTCKAVQQHSLLVFSLLCIQENAHTHRHTNTHTQTNMQTRQVKQQAESGTELNHVHSMSHVALGLPAFTSLCSVSLAACLCERACTSGHCRGLQTVREASLRPASCRTRL